MRVVLASSNAGKLKEFAGLLAPLGFEVLPQARYTRESAAETGLTFIENAILKARHASRASGLPAIADDSGIEVDALNGAPGVRSARYAGEGASDEQNVQKLIHAMRDIPAEQRTARYQCALAYLRFPDDPAPLLAQASWEGRIADAPRGAGGFGYDPVFEVPGRGLTAAELPPDEKNLLSHRGRALRQLVEALHREHGRLASR
ncbi:MAG TPA: RdgB/HAM1 family non-canonical purine NTP pyrophosphatase [Steroidobacter sp.]|jgi:XTP/dITP diphosphohydrolase|nr:RdgB/HAM1 family non-canonical purine NTP pyrophosphatase [Steroidobacteraceae bacterium]HLS81927.1 RdgB/HAM1 family non-canonical purine NTP pyrophosphatase [Steroidobacter sp.]